MVVVGAHGQSWLLSVLMVSLTFCCGAHDQSWLLSVLMSVTLYVAVLMVIHGCCQCSWSVTLSVAVLMVSFVGVLFHCLLPAALQVWHVESICITQVSMSRHTLTHNSLVHIQ